MLESGYRQELSRSKTNCLDWKHGAKLNTSGEVQQVQEMSPSDPCQTVSRPNSENIPVFVWQPGIGVGLGKLCGRTGGKGSIYVAHKIKLPTELNK